VIADLPVGENMQSHVGTGEIVFTLEEAVSFNPVRLFLNPLNTLAYLKGEGPLGKVSLAKILTLFYFFYFGFFMFLFLKFPMSGIPAIAVKQLNFYFISQQY
jgi:hypothetical protein